MLPKNCQRLFNANKGWQRLLKATKGSQTLDIHDYKLNSRVSSINKVCNIQQKTKITNALLTGLKIVASIFVFIGLTLTTSNNFHIELYMLLSLMIGTILFMIYFWRKSSLQRPSLPPKTHEYTKIHFLDPL